MTDRNPVPPASRDPHALLEQAFIAEYLADHGYRLDELANLPHEQARALMAEASRYASAKLAEVEARAHFVEDIDEGRQHRQR